MSTSQFLFQPILILLAHIFSVPNVDFDNDRKSRPRPIPDFGLTFTYDSHMIWAFPIFSGHIIKEIYCSLKPKLKLYLIWSIEHIVLPFDILLVMDFNRHCCFSTIKTKFRGWGCWAKTFGKKIDNLAFFAADYTRIIHKRCSRAFSDVPVLWNIGIK